LLRTIVNPIEVCVSAIEEAGMEGVAVRSPRAPATAGFAVPSSAAWQSAAQKIEQSIDYMRRHLNRSLPVARLAAMVGVSPSHFFALFKRRTGCAPIDFFIRLRMQQACRLLQETPLNVKEVAAVLGYDDPFYFSRAFKSVHGVAPTDYRLLPGEMREAIRSAALPGTEPCVLKDGPDEVQSYEVQAGL
jgi:AraC-like DNA-binding protein